jgi:glycosyltransferase involved in cell wall biosynthesis
MTIKVTVDGVPLLGPRTGVGRVVEETLSRIARRPDIRLSVYGWPPGGRRRLAATLPPGVRTVPIPMPGPLMRPAWRRFDLPPIECWSGRVDVVHGSNYILPPALRAGGLVSIYDLTFLRHPQYSNDDTLEFPSLLRRAVARGAWVHTISRFVAREIVDDLGADPDRVVTIHCGVNPPSVRAGTGSLSRLPFSPQVPYVLALGTIEPRKNLPRLVVAFDRLADGDPDLRLVLAGPDGWGVSELTTAIARATHRDRIVRLGWVTEDERSALLQNAAVYAYPSLYEGFGLPPLEAMAAGTPVVTARAGAIPEVVGDAALLVDPEDVDALAEAIAKVLADPLLADDLRERGHRNAEQYSWDRAADEMAALYHRVALDRHR